LLEGRSFLVVDDNALNLDLVTFALRQEGATTMAATTGPEALNRLRQEPQRYDAILMDIQMPGMDGLETIRAIRQELGLIHLPILALSAAVLPEQSRAALEAGANEFVPKPIEVAALVAALQRCWRTERPGGPGHDAGPGPVRSRFPQVAGLDTEHAAARLNHDVEFFIRSLGQFQEEFASLPRELREPWTATGPNEVTKRLHNLRGIAGIIGARQLSESAATLEKALRTADPEVDRLRLTFAQQLDALLQDIARLEAAS
jgi:CheY-like chemotaxis protein/HPt (histidine-containing phosphotransfer) domain-containing protein